MIEDESDPADEAYESILAECDEALATGQTPSALSPAGTPVEQQAGMERDLACIKLLRQWRSRAGSTAAPPAAAPPVRLGRFEIRQELGRGGFGVVFLALDTRLGRLVALKVPRADVLVTAELRARFQQEARAASALDHPHLVPIYEAGEIGAVCYIASAYCPGVTLAQWLEQRSAPMAGREAAALLVPLAEAVQHAHSRGILHRDLKPANILLHGGSDDLSVRAESPARNEESPLTPIPKITDFGLAKILPGESPARRQENPTVSGVIIGTPNYIAPEQAAGQTKDVTTAVDVYALGAILYEMVTGRPPFEGATAFETLERVRAHELMPPRRLRPTVARDLETICLKCLHKEPGQRYASAQALADDLKRYLGGEPILARPVSFGERARQWAKRRPAVATLIGMSVLALLALAAGGVWHVTQLSIALELAEDREKEANEQWQRAENNAAEADKQRQRAERRYRKAADAVRLMLTHVGGTRLAKVPFMVKVRRQLLEEALQFNLSLLEEKSDDPSMRAETASVYRQVGGIYHLLGQLPKAEKSLRRSLALYERLVADCPGQPDYRLGLAESWRCLGDVLSDLARPDKAEQATRKGLSILVEQSHRFPDVPEYRRAEANCCRDHGTRLFCLSMSNPWEQALRQALALQQQLAARYPKAAVYCDDLAKTLTCLGGYLIQLERTEEAEQIFARALPLLEKAVPEFGVTPDYRYELGSIQNHLAALRIKMKHFQEAEKPCRDAIATRSKLATDFPKLPSYWRDLGISYHNLFLVLASRKRWPEAQEAFDKAYRIRKQLVNELPGTADYQNDLAHTLWCGARVDMLTGQWPAARKRLEEAILHHLAAFKANPEIAKYRLALYHYYATLADCLLKLGDHREAAKAAAELPRLYPKGTQTHCTTARLLALCATVAGKDDKLASIERVVLVQSYADQAMEQLRGERRHGQLRADQLRKDIVFEPLRARKDFQQLLSELEESSHRDK
jgi:tetratricopeptide (TPR) repeat protein